MPERFVQREDPPPTPSAEITEERLKEIAAHKRAMPIQRLLDNGMDHADAVDLHALTAANLGWTEAAQWLGERNLRRAAAAAHPATARGYHRHASACFRFAQSAFVHDDDRKRALYRRLIDAFALGIVGEEHPARKIEVPWQGSALCGWLLTPRGAIRPPVVIVFGGADAWRESYYGGARYLLERGVAALLLDGPGQGETRLFRSLYLTADYDRAFAAVIQALADDGALGDRIGIYGNSMGGHLAAKVASVDPRIAACCANGGTIRPLEILDRFPRFIDRLAAMVGTRDPDVAMGVMQALDLTRGAAGIACPLLVLHGAPDQVFLLENARRVYDLAASPDKTLMVWDDGDHCLYNHAHEKHSLVADWFADRLRA